MTNLEKIFRRLLWIDIFTIIFLFYIIFTGKSFGLDPNLIELQEYLSLQINIIIYLPAIICLVILLISYPFLFKYKNLGRLLYCWSCIIGFALILFMGPIVSDPISAFIDSISAALSGGLLILMYCTPLSENFKTAKVNEVSSLNLTAELDRVSNLYKDGLISAEEFQAAKEKLLK